MMGRLFVCLISAFFLVIAVSCPTIAGTKELRVCADPNNLPFSNRQQQGFENKIAELIARQLNAQLQYTWWAQRRGYARHTLKAGACDLWPGIASGIETAATTQPYYRSTYMFVSRVDRKLDIRSFDDPRLRHLKIGVQMVGDDATNTPPTYALARRGLIDNVRGYSLYGDYQEPNPPRAIIDAVANQDVDVAVVWGPPAGYFAALEPVPLRLSPVDPQIDGSLPMAFNIAMGVRRGNSALKDEIDKVLSQQRKAIATLLTAYHVPWSEPFVEHAQATDRILQSSLRLNH